MKSWEHIAKNYDRINNVMTFGLYNLWIRCVASKLEGNVLDLACGTGKIANLATKRGLKVTAVDKDSHMLKNAKKNEYIAYYQATAEDLPFKENSFDSCSIGFGLRNFSNRNKALKEIRRVLRPKGKLVILETSIPKSKAIKSMQKMWIFLIANLPFIHKKSYKCLYTSTNKFPTPRKIKQELERAGFTNIKIKSLACGVATIYEN